MRTHITSHLAIVSIAGALIFTRAAQADAVLDWNAIMQSTVAAQAPFPQARFAAITQLAVFEAVNAITKQYKHYLSTGTIPAPQGASADAAVIAAAQVVLKTYFPAATAMLEAFRTSSLAAIPDGPAKSAGIGVGEAAAAAVMAARNNDGSSPAAFYLPVSSRPGEWQTRRAARPRGERSISGET